MRGLYFYLFCYRMVCRNGIEFDVDEIFINGSEQVRFLIHHPAQVQPDRCRINIKRAAYLQQLIGYVIRDIVIEIPDQLQLLFFAKHKGHAPGIKNQEQLIAAVHHPVCQQRILMPLGGCMQPFFKKGQHRIGYPMRIIEVVFVEKVMEDGAAMQVAKNEVEHFPAMVPVEQVGRYQDAFGIGPDDMRSLIGLFQQGLILQDIVEFFQYFCFGEFVRERIGHHCLETFTGIEHGEINTGRPCFDEQFG